MVNSPPSYRSCGLGTEHGDKIKNVTMTLKGKPENIILYFRPVPIQPVSQPVIEAIACAQCKMIPLLA